MNHRGYLQVKALGKVSMGLIGKTAPKVHKVHLLTENITPIAREYRGVRSIPVIRVNQSDNQILHLPTVLVCRQMEQI